MPRTKQCNKRGTVALMCRVPLTLGNKIVSFADSMNVSINEITHILLEYAMEHAKLEKCAGYELRFDDRPETE